MGYSHGSRDLKDRHDRYGGISYLNAYLAPKGRKNPDNYLGKGGFSYTSHMPSYLSNDSYRLKERLSGSIPFFQYDKNFAKQFKGYSMKRLESRLYQN